MLRNATPVIRETTASDSLERTGVLVVGRRLRRARACPPAPFLQEASMFYETATNDHGLPYNPLKACVVPRPIGWITTINADGLVNLAPFSFFNVLSYDPPFVLFS